MSIAGLVDTLSNVFSKGKKTERYEFLKRLPGYSNNELANVTLAILVGSTVELTLGKTLCIYDCASSDTLQPSRMCSMCTWDPIKGPISAPSSRELDRQRSSPVIFSKHSVRRKLRFALQFHTLIVVSLNIGIDPPRPGVIRPYTSFVLNMILSDRLLNIRRRHKRCSRRSSQLRKRRTLVP
jgi:hypothetical protein